MSSHTNRVLVLVPQEVEELELVAPVDLLRRAGSEVILAGIFEGIHCTGRNGLTLHVDRPLAAEDTPDAYGMLLLPGGPGVRHLRADRRVVPLVRSFHEAGRRIAAICAAPTVLKDAGLLPGPRFTAHFSTCAELKDALDEAVVEDGNVITSRGAGTATAFGLALVEALHGAAKAGEVRAAICA